VSDRFEEFKQKCLDEEQAKRLDSVEGKREARRFENQSEYHMKAVEDLLEGEANLIAIVEGYYSMLHKANQVLTLAGFKPDSHKCTLLGIRGVFDRSDLAETLQRAMDERINVDYYMDPEKPDMEEFKDPQNFVNQEVKPFIQEIEELIESEELRKRE
jgi:uncharacterized protein (UPF0332 family)